MAHQARRVCRLHSTMLGMGWTEETQEQDSAVSVCE